MDDDYIARWITEDIPNRPEDWPTYNLRELKVARVWQDIREYYADPNPVARDIMLRDAFCRERAELPSIGPKYRISSYEAEMVNRIYRAGCCFCSCALRLFAYHVVIEWIDDDRYFEEHNKQLQIADMVVTESKKRKEILPWQLQLFYETYFEYCEDWARRRFADILLNICRRFIAIKQDKKDLYELEHAIVSLIYDISGNLSSERDECFAFTREEIFRLINLEAQVLHKRNQSIMKRPLKGTLMIQLSNLILRTRRNGNTHAVFKYISLEKLNAAITNHQIWISDTGDLNDKYEGKVAQEVVNAVAISGLNWTKNVKLKYHKKFYVGCYSKKFEMKELQSRYGECILGYYGDRLVDYLGPVYWRVEKLSTPQGEVTEAYPMFSQVFVLDVIYDSEEAKRELQFLISCIDKLGQTESEKRRFYCEILQYWKLSFKDAVNRDAPYEKWYEENERRYVIHHYDGYDYKGSFVDKKDRKLKFETMAVLAPDFILGCNSKSVRNDIATRLEGLYEYTTIPHYYVCDNCFAKGVYQGGFTGSCLECGCTSVTKHASKAFHYKQ